MPTTAILTFRNHRFAVVAVGVGCLLLALAAVGVALWLGSFNVPQECLDNPEIRGTLPCLGTDDALAINEEWAGKVMAAMAVLPFVSGLLLGVPLVGTEIETGTATIAWSLSSSRRRWLLARVAVLGVTLAVLLAVPAIAANALEAERLPRFDLATAVILDFGLRGPLVVARGLAMFSISLLIGLAMGRVLPGLIVAGVAGLVLYYIVSLAQGVGWPAPEPFDARPGAYFMEYPHEWVDHEGTAFSFQELVARAPAPLGDPAFDTWLADNYREVAVGIAGERLAIVEQRELGGLAVLTLALVGTSAWLIERRRPY